MQYSFTALTLAILATAIHASPIQLETRDIITIADPNAANTTMSAPPAPPAGAPAPPTPADAANGTMAAPPAPPSGKPTPPAPAAKPDGTMPAPPAPPSGKPAPPAPGTNGTMAAPPAPPAGAPAPPAPGNATDAAAPATEARDLTSFSITDTSQANTTSSANSTTITATVTDPTTNTTGTVFPGTAANCTTFFIVSMGDTCDSVDAKNGITLETLRSLNTEIDAGCTNLGVGQALCVKT
ncbi:hypothetical protein BCIN_02g05630 [Botrytis cinerea B05.10]|uniref:LysM domain-containing protein n=2 Tax=Botryotinia fuckeliana TaxID=40559 RepID=A0A384J9V8_BOTFB|nr:hypothetical protein BCIN_02g05630 [Botrytis cinerea B05.10]ATZ47270.1 hypothetical protein BCIN_02g05630 [Botrytis cinerea B05.10]CCD55706.1 hypothetical protein BofuT4_P152680.1 [Botrytis cinerea T4]